MSQDLTIKVFGGFLHSPVFIF